MQEYQHNFKRRSIANPFSDIRDMNEAITGHVSGRKADIIELVMGGQSAVILAGAPSIGKSTLLRYLERPPCTEWSWRNELADESSLEYLNTIHFAQIDLSQVVIADGQDPKTSGEQFVTECAKAVYQAYGRTEQSVYTMQLLRDLLREERYQHPRGRCFIMLDAIERLIRPGTQSLSSVKTPQEQAIALLDHSGIIRILIDLIDEFRNFGVIIAIESLPRPSVEDQFVHVSADLARFTTTTLQVFTLEDSRAFLRQRPESYGAEWASRFKETGKQTIFSEEERAWLLQQAGTHPYILQQFCWNTFHLKQDDMQQAPYELQELYKRQLIEYINGRLSTFLTRIWVRLQEALDRSRIETKDKFNDFIELLSTNSISEQAIDPVAWDQLGTELHYILRSEGIVRFEPWQPVYYPGDTLCKFLVAKAKTSSGSPSVSPGVLSSTGAPSSRNLWLTISLPERKQQQLLLSEIEYRLFKTLLQASGRSHEEDLIKNGWDMPVSRTTLTQRIHHLRKKLREVCSDEEIIQNHYGGFYSLNHPESFVLDR